VSLCWALFVWMSQHRISPNQFPKVWLKSYLPLSLSLILYAQLADKREASWCKSLTSCLTGLDQSVLQIKTKIHNWSYSWFQTSKAGGQRYSDPSPLSIPCYDLTQIQTCKLSRVWKTLEARGWRRPAPTGTRSCRRGSTASSSRGNSSGLGSML
jgi:hypothetical protein